MWQSDLENTKESLLPDCDKTFHKIKENLPHWEELEKLWNHAFRVTVAQNETNLKDIRVRVKHRSAKFQTPANAVDFLWSFEGLWRSLSFVFSRSDCHLTI